MKTLRPVLALALITTLLASCSTSNDVVGGIFQKRKYNKGFYWNQGGNKKSDRSEKESDVAIVTEKAEIRTLEKNTVENIESGDKSLATPAKVASAVSQQATENNLKTDTKAVKKSETVTSTDDKSTVFASEKTVIREKKGKSIPQLLNKKQKSESGADSSAMFVLAVIFAILIPPLGVLIYTNIDWVKVLICLLLTILFFLPGMIYALLVVFDVI